MRLKRGEVPPGCPTCDGERFIAAGESEKAHHVEFTIHGSVPVRPCPACAQEAD